MNIQNPGSQESLGVEYIDDIYAKFCFFKGPIWKQLVFL